MPKPRLTPIPDLEHSVHAVHPEQVLEARRRLLTDEGYVDLAEIFRALADSTRAKIVHLLAEQSLCVCDLAQAIGVSEPAVSQHLRLLRALRVVRGRRAGKMVYYRLEDAHVRALLRIALDHSAEADKSEREDLPS
ncbi:MAG TPA: metalloregulator ArsR/SmtB family transcription factor [Dehalococcoidia bacterium]|nr:metalloregulator ArsR/SmtB family transcription factor [Dehalococcoidia bacterium]